MDTKHVSLLATHEVEGWALIDAEARNKESPLTFEIPSLKERQSLKRGSVVRLAFSFAKVRDDAYPMIVPSTERMWVYVLAVSSDPSGNVEYTGKLDNAPYTTDVIKYGAFVHFEPRHVASLLEV